MLTLFDCTPLGELSGLSVSYKILCVKSSYFTSSIHLVESHIQNWKGKPLLAARRKVLIKLILLSYHIFLLSYYYFPSTIINLLHYFIARFWRGGADFKFGIVWDSLDKICQPIDKGGRGFRNSAFLI